jgi:hypothetical protein
MMQSTQKVVPGFASTVTLNVGEPSGNAGIIHLITHKSEAAWDSRAAKIAGATSIVLWLAILALGRLVAYDWMTTEYFVE